MPTVGNLAGGYRDPMDGALAEVEAAIAKARELGAARSIILGRVANGLTGAINGYRERLLTKALTSAADAFADLTQEEAKRLEPPLRPELPTTTCDAKATVVIGGVPGVVPCGLKPNHADPRQLIGSVQPEYFHRWTAELAGGTTVEVTWEADDDD